MQDVWFGDKRDIVKWSVLLHLAEKHQCGKILQIAYYRSGTIEIDGEAKNLPIEVTAHFGNIRSIKHMKAHPEILVFDNVLTEDRSKYLAEACEFIRRFSKDRCVVFLDPDTGLAPLNTKPTLKHVRPEDALGLFKAMEPNDIFVLYQHQTNRNGKPWIEPKRQELCSALGEIKINSDDVKIARGKDIASDVVFYFLQKKT